MPRAKRPVAGQGALFEVAAPGCTHTGLDVQPGCPYSCNPKRPRREPTVREWPGGIKPWDPINEADRDLGWQYTYVTPRRAVEIRAEIEHG